MSETQVPTELLERLDRIERQNKTLKRVVGLVTLCVVALVLMAQAPARTRILEAERLIIRYPNGKEAIVLGTLAESAEANFLSPNGSLGAWVIAGSQGSSVYVRSPKGEQQTYMHARSEFSESDIRRSDFRTPIGKAADFGISGRRQTMFLVTSDTSGETGQYMYSENGAQLRLTNGPNGTAVQLWDDPKTLRAVLGKTSLEQTRSGTVETRPLSSLVLFDKDRKVLWEAP